MPDRSPPTIDVVVPTFNGWSLTESCLRHLAAQTVRHRVIVADNGSTDETRAQLAGRDDVTLVALDTNLGFGAACNAGAAAGHGDVVVLLNNDVDAAPDFLERLVAPLDDRRVGSVAGLLVRPDGDAIDSIGITVDATLSGFPRLQGRPVAEASAAHPRLVGPSGGAAAYRRSAWDALGGLDQRMFLYHEDVDLAVRLRAAGWEAAAAPDAVGVHHGSATAGRGSAFQREHAAWSRGYLLRRWGLLGGRAAPRTLLTEAIVALGDLVLSRDAAALRGRVRGWRAAGGLERRTPPWKALDGDIGLRDAMALRRGDYAIAKSGTSA